MAGIAYRTAQFAATRSARLLYDYPKVIRAKRRHRGGVKSGILETHAGDLSFDNGRFAIFLIWQPHGVQWFVQNALDAFRETETNVVVVANHTLSDDLLSRLKPHCHTILVRNNEGFDIGGYRDATLHVVEAHAPERLVYVNDSIYFFKEGLSELFSRLGSSQADICTAFENWEFRYHIQSFCFSVSRNLMQTDAFMGFWRDYIPANSRRWAIHKGEIGLSKAIVSHARGIEVVYNPNDLRDPLYRMPISELRSLQNYLPYSQRSLPNGRINAEQMAEAIIHRVATRSQIHTGGFLYSRFLKNPIIKRDLVYRMQFSVYDVENCLRECPNAEHVDEILAEMRRKGPGTQLPLIKRIQFMDGII